MSTAGFPFPADSVGRVSSVPGAAPEPYPAGPEPPFTGVGVALVTLFDGSGDLDAPATADHAARLASLGISAVLVAGTTGEAAALAPDERRRLLAAVRGAVPSGTAVIAGTGAPSARQAVALTADAAAGGADAVLALSPPFASDPRPYYDQVAKAAAGVPLLAYHYPAVSPPGVAADLLPELPVVGVKDSSGSPERLLATLSGWDGAVYVGSAGLLAMAGHLGAAGAILALANAEPELCAAAFRGEAGAQLRLAAAHAESSGEFPHAIKAMTARRFSTSTTARMGA